MDKHLRPPRFSTEPNTPSVPSQISSGVLMHKTLLTTFLPSSYYSKWIQNFSEKVRPLSHCTSFPISATANEAFETLKEEVKNAAVASIDPDALFEVETDVSDYAIGATLNQGGRPVAFFSRTLNTSESGLHPVEKEAYAIIESIRSWRHFLLGRHFRITTDQRSVAFMYDNRRRSKTKNDKIARWRIDLSEYSFDVTYRPGEENAGPDALSRIDSCCATQGSESKLREAHDALCHPGITRLNHFVKSRNLPFSVSDVRDVVNTCETCAELKPKFHRFSGKLIKATQPFQRLNIDFKGPLPASSPNRYLLTVVDEYSRFPFAYPCRDIKSSTVISCLEQLFSIFGMPSFIHNDRAPDFLYGEIKQYLSSRGIATSCTSRYKPRGNGQVERYNGTIWKTILLALKSKKISVSNWENVLPEALHSIRSLLCVSTNSTPHERLFSYTRQATAGNTVPTWLLSPGPVYVKRHTFNSKYDPRVEKAELIEANPEYAFVRLDSGHETTVSLRNVAPYVPPVDQGDIQPTRDSDTGSTEINNPVADPSTLATDNPERAYTLSLPSTSPPPAAEEVVPSETPMDVQELPQVRRSSRVSVPLKRFKILTMIPHHQ